MIKVKISKIGVAETLDLRDELLISGLTQGPDFSFSFHPKEWDSFTGDIPSWAEFDFKDKKRSLPFLLKYSNRACIIE
jgi:hypothetical protein